jgi:predicted amidohydrolase
VRDVDTVVAVNARADYARPATAPPCSHGADLIVLPELVTFGRGASDAGAAESIPGPSTAFFGALAHKHGVHLVPGLLERDGDRICNVVTAPRSTALRPL